MSVIGALLAVALTIAFVWTLIGAARRPSGYRRLFDGHRFRAVLPWVAIATVAGVAGALLAGGGDVVLVILAIAVLVLWAADRADFFAGR